MRDPSEIRESCARKIKEIEVSELVVRSECLASVITHDLNTSLV
jgi:hypothetical protein